MEDDDGTNRNRFPKFNLFRRTLLPIRRLTPDADAINKIMSAFSNVKSFPLRRIIIQFWRPVNIGGKNLLSCSGNPYSLLHVNRRLSKYRSTCCRYYYSLDDSGGPMTISGAPPSSAFLNHFPEVILDLRVHRGTPLVDLALECGLTCFVMLPVFSETSCVGVVEVSMRPPGLVVIFNELKSELKRVGLSVTPPWARWQQCKTMATTSDLVLARSQMKKALLVACKSHAITLCQVWFPSQHSRRLLLTKWTSCYVLGPVGDHAFFVQHFYHDIFFLPLTKVEGLAVRTLVTRRPHLCRSIYKLSDNRGALAVLSANTKCTSFVICLKSSQTGELPYAFEFFWPQSRNHLAMMEDLLLTLRDNLPTFKYASGAQLGDELLVVDVENSSSGSGSGSTPIKIFSAKGTPKPIKETRALAGMKRKSIEGQSELNQANEYPLTSINNPEGEDEDDDDLIILALYKVDCRLFFLPSSTTFEDVMEKINEEFELNPTGTYKIEYQVLPGEWYSLTDDTCLKSCISSYRTSKNIDHIKLGVLAVEK